MSTTPVAAKIKAKNSFHFQIKAFKGLIFRLSIVGIIIALLTACFGTPQEPRASSNTTPVTTSESSISFSNVHVGLLPSNVEPKSFSPKD